MDTRQLVEGLRAGDRRSLARAITLVESELPEHTQPTLELLAQCRSHWKPGLRLGISGAPGVGKSSLIEALGASWVKRGTSLSVLAVDPSSSHSGGSIMGDKTRMSALSRMKEVYVRPSPSGPSGDSVTSSCSDAIFLCECAGFSPCLVETVGVGQAEIAVANLVDLLLVVLEPGAGDELQGIKRGLLEWADLIVVNKADGERMSLAAETVQQYRAALGLTHRVQLPPHVLSLSAATGEGVPECLDSILQRFQELDAAGNIARRRAEGGARELERRLRGRLFDQFLAAAGRSARFAELSSKVRRGEVLPAEAVAQLLDHRFDEGA